MSMYISTEKARAKSGSWGRGCTSLASGIFPQNSRMKLLLCDVHVHLDCAGSHKTWVTGLVHVLVWDTGLKFWSFVTVHSYRCLYLVHWLPTPHTVWGLLPGILLACYITGWFFEDKIMFPVTDKQYLGWLNHQSCCLFNTFLFLLNPVQPGLDFWCKID